MKSFGEISSWFAKQNRNTKLMIGGAGLVLLIGLCSLSGMFAKSTKPAVISPASNGTVMPTLTPFPTITPVPTDATPRPTNTPLPTGLPTIGFETATIVVLPTAFSSKGNDNNIVVITAVDKVLEYVDIQNASYATVSIDGWTLVSEVGRQSCILRGLLQPTEVLRIWAGKGQMGLSCKFNNPIWADEALDPAVLYNARGEEVSRFPKLEK